MVYDLVGLLIAVLDIYCIFLIVTSPGDAGKKLLWIILVLLLPLLGPVLYFVIGKGRIAL